MYKQAMIFIVQRPGGSRLTKIHDQPRRPYVPFINEMPYASRPEKAPAIEAAPKKRPTRSWYIERGYHIDRLQTKCT